MNSARLTYRRQQRLGGGSGGDVYQARLWCTGERVAVKELNKAQDANHQLERLRAEAAALTALNHPGIVAIRGVRQLRGARIAMVMEYVDGCSLAQLLHGGPLPYAAALYVARALLDALGHAHEHGIVHRDISPNNVLIARDGQVKLVDFGLARAIGTPATTGHHISGTLPFIAPEQVLGANLDGRVDLFAVGVLLYVMLTGQPPFIADGRAALLAQIIGATPEHDLLPSSIADVVARMLKREREARFASAELALGALPDAPNGCEQLCSLVAARIPRTKRQPRTNFWLAAVAVAGLTIGYHRGRTAIQPVVDSKAAVVQVEQSEVTTGLEAPSAPSRSGAPEGPDSATKQSVLIGDPQSQTKAQVQSLKEPSKRKRKRRPRTRRLKRASPMPAAEMKKRSITWERKPTRGMTIEYGTSSARRSN